MLTRVPVLACLIVGLAASALAQPQRVMPYPVMLPPQFERAVANGTRTTDGTPGPDYWQNRADYELAARLDETDQTLHGTGTITYTNNSPDELEYLVVKLKQNVHAPGVVRNRPVAVTGGMTLESLTVEGAALSDASSPITPGRYTSTVMPGTYAVDGTILTLGLATPLEPGASTTLELAWSYRVPPATGTYRQGTDGEVYYLGYWYPQMAVYDDVIGWHTDPYMGNGEHYLGYGDYTVTFDVPSDWLAWGTGELVNANEVLTAETRRRLDLARSADGIVNVVTEDERGTATLASSNGRSVWRFRAENVRDVALSASASYVWDATHANVDQDGDGADDSVLINAFYRPGTASWERSAEFAKFSIEHLSEMILPYPYPHMTAVEGIIGGGMEYPMMTLIGGDRTDATLFSVTYHEIGHMWFPMVVGSNEKGFTWMDEGLTTYNTREGAAAFFDGSSESRPKADPWARDRQSHYRLAGTGYAVEPMRHNDRYPTGGGTRQVDPVGGSARSIASYSTPSVLMHAMAGIFGREDFFTAYQEYARRWAFKHPTPYDFFNTFEDQLGQDLDWLWTPTLFETWTVDYGIRDVQEVGSGIKVFVEDLGLAPMPVVVEVTYTDGRTARQTVDVDTWLSGATETRVSFRAGTVASARLDPDGFLPDVDPSNNELVLIEPDEASGTGR
ncbi:MAG: M1 family metallopeptidase [Rubricoccaceae bacterium]